MANVFWDSERVIHVGFLSSRATVNGQYYSNLFPNYVHAAVRKKSPGKLTEEILLLHCSVDPRATNLTTTTLAPLGWEILNHPFYSLGLAPSDYQLFGAAKEHLGRQKFKTGELKRGVLSCLRVLPSYISAAGISAFSL
jgi:hypothetical protein